MLGDFSTPAKLAEHPLCQSNGITDSLIIETERKARDALPMELETIAVACGLPRTWFTADFEALEDQSAVVQHLERLETSLAEIRQLALDAGLPADDATRAAMTSTRAVTQALKGRAVGGESSPEVAGGTRDEADATQAAARSHRGAKS